MKKLIVANWKMNPRSFGEAERLAKSVFKFAKGIRSEVVLCSPFVWLTDLSRKYYRRVAWGAQDVFWEEAGAFTGEVSSAMLKNSKVIYVIVGHSERRRWLGETDEVINKKVLAVLRAGLKVILCVGEPLSVRRRGLTAAKRFVGNQLRKDLKGISLSRVAGRTSLIIAYEPIWAIGTGRPDKPEETAEMAMFIKNQFPAASHPAPSGLASPKGRQLPVLYGGSVNSKNARSFLQLKEIDGALVGGASLKAKEFKKIMESVN